jgi:hypothetical protein
VASPDLKVWLHKDITRLEKLLIILAAINKPCSLSDIRVEAKKAGFRALEKWNISSVLLRSNGLAIKVPEGWELTQNGYMRLAEIGVNDFSIEATKVSADLRKCLERIADADTRSFLLEAIQCHEHRLYRSAVIMSWIGAMSVLHKYVYNYRLADFNVEATRVDPKWKAAITSDDLANMKEDKFIETIERISILGKSVKDSLKECLKRRNGCGHPNSLKLGVNQSAAHIESLIQNVFEPYS